MVPTAGAVVDTFESPRGSAFGSTVAPDHVLTMAMVVEAVEPLGLALVDAAGELLDAALAKVGAVNPALNAVVLVQEGAAMGGRRARHLGGAGPLRSQYPSE